MKVFSFDWKVDIHPKWHQARWLLAAPLLPFVALLSLAGSLIKRRPFPWWVQLTLAIPALVCLGLPTRLYEVLRIVTVLEEQEVSDATVPAS